MPLFRSVEMTERRSMFSAPRDRLEAETVLTSTSVQHVRKRWTSSLQPCVVFAHAALETTFLDKPLVVIKGPSYPTIDRLSQAVIEARLAQPTAFVGICDERLVDDKYRKAISTILTSKGDESALGCFPHLELSDGFQAVFRATPRS